jgi:hypothetical protein
VITGTPIEATWANTSLADMSQALTDSLSRSAQGTMQAQLRAIDGTKAVPGLSFVNEASTGWYRPSVGDLRVSVLGVDYVRCTSANGVEISTDDGANWYAVTTAETTTTMQGEIDQNAIDIGANTDSIVILADRVTVLEAADPLVTASLKIDGPIRQLLNEQDDGNAAIPVDLVNRHHVSNDGNLTLTFSGEPSGADTDLGDFYQVEGQVTVLNTGSPGTVTIAGISEDYTIGIPSATPNGASILTYILQYSNGTTRNVFVWSVS